MVRFITVIYRFIKARSVPHDLTLHEDHETCCFLLKLNYKDILPVLKCINTAKKKKKNVALLSHIQCSCKHNLLIQWSLPLSGNIASSWDINRSLDETISI